MQSEAGKLAANLSSSLNLLFSELFLSEIHFFPKNFCGFQFDFGQTKSRRKERERDLCVCASWPLHLHLHLPLGLA